MTALGRSGASARTRIGIRLSPLLVALMGLMFSACQQGPHPNFEQTDTGWRVVESVGDSWVERGGSYQRNSLRSGDRVAGASRIVTGRSAQLIMSRGGLQFTAGNDTMVVLPAKTQGGALSHGSGALRVRLASAANAVQQIATPHLTVSGANAVFDLEIVGRSTTITVDQGAVNLATADGNHHARLIAGAAARLGDGTEGLLEIRPAAGLPFRPSAPTRPADLPAVEKPVVDHVNSAPSVNAPPLPKAAMEAADENALSADAASVTEAMVRKALSSERRKSEPIQAVIVPASRPRTPARMADDANLQREPDLQGKTAPTEPVLIPARAIHPADMARPEVQAMPRRTPLEHRFDRLTEGLLDGLPPAGAVSPAH